MKRWLIVTAIFTTTVLVVSVGAGLFLHLRIDWWRQEVKKSAVLIENRTTASVDIVDLSFNGKRVDVHRRLKPGEFSVLLGLRTDADHQAIELSFMSEATGTTHTFSHYARQRGRFQARDFKFVIGPESVEATEAYYVMQALFR
jgi:hypothetical protein